MAFDQHAGEFVTHSLVRHLVNFGCKLPGSFERSRVKLVIETRGKPNRTQHPQLVFTKSQQRIADGTNDSGRKVFLATHVIENLVVQGIE